MKYLKKFNESRAHYTLKGPSGKDIQISKACQELYPEIKEFFYNIIDDVENFNLVLTQPFWDKNQKHSSNNFDSGYFPEYRIRFESFFEKIENANNFIKELEHINETFKNEGFRSRYWFQLTQIKDYDGNIIPDNDQSIPGIKCEIRSE